MKEKLINLLDNSYSPYSKFKVSAIVVMKDGKEFSGVNVENSSYGATICAERSAIVSAISNGYKKGDFKELYVMTTGNKISMCCMICRQVILEFFDKESIIKKDDELNSEIKFLKEQNEHLLFFSKLRNKIKIKKLLEEKNQLLPLSLKI